MRRKQGLTLLELILAIAILVTILAMASAGVVLALQAQRGQEAVTSSQAKLRRVNEAVLQELRGAVLGGVTSDPIPAGKNSVSFTVIDGGAGYAVESLTNTQITFVAAEDSAAALDFGEGQVLLVNSDGMARVLSVAAPTQLSTNRFVLTHTSCSVAYPMTADILMFKVKTVGFNYKAAEKTLFQKVGSGDELPLAYGMSKFDINYIYQNDSDGAYQPRETPYLDADNQPDRRGVLNGENVQLARLNFTLGTSAPSIGGRTISRQYTGQLELLNTVSDNRFRAVRGVVPCN